MKNILCIMNGDFYSGAERVEDMLAMQLPALGYRVFFACLKGGMFPQYCQVDKRYVHAFHMRSRFDLGVAFKIAKFAREHHCALLHTHTPRAVMIGRVVALLTGLPMVHHAHSPTVHCTEDPWRNRINFFVERLSMNDCAHIIAVSGSLMKSLLAANVPRQRLSCVVNGVATPQRLPPRQPPVGDWTIGITAMFRPRKGFEVLLDALAVLRKRGHLFRLWAVGRFETEAYKQIIVEQVERLDLTQYIQWRGFQQDVQAELAHMDLFVLPSLSGEGTPLVILEAMANGVPVVATAVEGIPDVIRDGLEGTIVAPGDSEALAMGLEKYITGEMDWESIRRQAYERQSTLYSERRMATDVAAIYARIIGK